MTDISELILAELREHRSESNRNFDALLQRTSVLETKVEDLEDLNPRVSKLEEVRWTSKGIYAAVTIALSMAGPWLSKKVFGI